MRLKSLIRLILSYLGNYPNFNPKISFKHILSKMNNKELITSVAMKMNITKSED